MEPVLNLPLSPAKKSISGWAGVVIFALLYAGLYAANFWIPLQEGSYTIRIWDWTRVLLTGLALIALLLNRQLLAPGNALLGLGLAALTGISYTLRNPGLIEIIQEGLAVWACFVAGVVLFKEPGTTAIPAFRLPAARIGRSLAFGVLAAVPLAVLNNLFFYFNSGPIHFQSVIASALGALKPGISEEIVYRFFILAVCFNFLRSSDRPRLVMAAALFLAVVPHSLNHLPDLFLENPTMGFVMLAATSLLFGLPMALLQVKRNLETAVGFHWFIDFARFLCGY